MKTLLLEKRLLTEKETASILNVSTKTLWSWRKKKIIPFHRLGEDVIRYTTEDIRNFLEGSRVPAEEARGDSQVGGQ